MIGFSFGLSLFMAAVGAIFIWAVNLQVQGIEIGTIGVILLVVGILGAIVSALLYASRNERDDWDGYR